LYRCCVDYRFFTEMKETIEGAFAKSNTENDTVFLLSQMIVTIYIVRLCSIHLNRFYPIVPVFGKIITGQLALLKQIADLKTLVL